MVKLLESDIRSRDVLAWKGLHLFHYAQSSCSQKLRIFLNLKEIAWDSHPIDLMRNENLSDWFLGINPRGLVPVLVDDGSVHIESNDILTHLESKFPSPKLIPAGAETRIAELLKHEDDLHMDLRRLSFRFVFAPPGPPKSKDDLVQYAKGSSGTVQGQQDAGLAEQIDFWKRYEETGHIPDAEAKAAAQHFRAAFDQLESELSTHRYLFGEAITVVDIAWFIYVNRLMLAGYPFDRLHPRLAAWFGGLNADPRFAREIALPEPARQRLEAMHRDLAKAGQTLEQVAAL